MSSLSAGALVRLHGLHARADLNGKRGRVVVYHAGRGRYEVKVRGEAKTLAIKQSNLTDIESTSKLVQMMGELDFMQEQQQCLIALPGERLCIAVVDSVHIVDKNLKRLKKIGGEVYGPCDESGAAPPNTDVHFPYVGGLAASEDGLYVSEPTPANVRRFDLETFKLVAGWGDRKTYEGFCELAVAPGRAVFAIALLMGGAGCEIVAFDPLTLALQYVFGRGLFPDVGSACGIAVVGEELFVGNTPRSSLHVFSLGGEHLREIAGDWHRALSLCCVGDRLYMIEEIAVEQDGPEELFAARRLLALTLEGVTLQVYRPPVQQWVMWGLCEFAGKPLVAGTAMGPVKPGKAVEQVVTAWTPQEDVVEI
eukprot:5126986-Prymnesium_polylepis.1